MKTLSTPEILAAVEDRLGDWRKLAQPLVARYRTPDLAGAAAFAGAVAEAARAMEGAGATAAASGAEAVGPARSTRATGPGEPTRQQAGLRLGSTFVDISLYALDGETGRRLITERTLELAWAISELAQRHGLLAAPHEVAQLEFGLDTADAAAVSPFWAALLTGDPGHIVDQDVLDPTHRVPNVWFQPTEPHTPPRQRWHPDLWLAPEVAQERIAAAVAAGGTVVDESCAPSFIVLADPDGNKVCVCTAQGRE